jgi:hypothetical protein
MAAIAEHRWYLSGIVAPTTTRAFGARSELYRSCFADRFRVNFERLTGLPEVYVDADLWTRFADGGASEYVQNGWYENSFARSDGQWKITRLLHTYQAVPWSPPGT